MFFLFAALFGSTLLRSRLFRSSFLCCSFLASRSLGLVLSSFLLRLCLSRFWSRLLLWFRQLRCCEALAVKCNLGDAYFGVWLPMSVNLLVLLLAFEMEDQNLVTATRLHNLAADDSIGSRAYLAIIPGDRQNIIEFNRIALVRGQLFNSHDISRGHSILFSPGANHRVHNFSP